LVIFKQWSLPSNFSMLILRLLQAAGLESKSRGLQVALFLCLAVHKSW
jgi:hypothetical protein